MLENNFEITTEDILSLGKPRITEVPAEPAAIEPLHPSSEPSLACAHGYRARKQQRVESIAGRRGSEFHRFMLEPDGYIARLVDEGLREDESWWRAALYVAECGDDARELLEDFLPGFNINPDHVLDLERRLYLDAEMNIIYSPSNAVVSGQPDLVLLNAEAQRVRIIDFKSQYSIVDASESFQAKAYSLMMLQALEFVREVEFELAFVRYGNAKRTVIYTREHIPHLKKAVMKTRQRQLSVERQIASGNLEQAVPGPACIGCPLRLKGCPITDINPYTQQSGEDLIRFAKWAEGAREQAMDILKQMYAEAKAPAVTDGNGRILALEVKERERKEVSLDGLDIVREWNASREKKQDLLSKLRIGGLSTKLKAKFRQPLFEQLDAAGYISRTPYTVFQISVSGVDEGEDEES